jgi:uncharacterized membrane protein
MDWLLLLRWLHVVGACVLLGTGAGIAFFMLVAHRTGKPALVAHVAGTVVLADTLFTATVVLVQPITGTALAWGLGWSLTEGWIALSLVLYAVTGAFWLPVVVIQIRLRDLAREAEAGGKELPARYHRLWRIWFAFGFPAFASVMGIVWLMLARPGIAMPW